MGTQDEEVPLDAIRAFVTVPREGSVTRAATTLRTTQSSVSRYLSVLRDYLGADLIERRGRRSDLTEFGRLFANAVSEPLETVGFADKRMRRRAGKLTSAHCIWIGLSIGKAVYAALLALRLQRCFNLNLEPSIALPRYARRGDAESRYNKLKFTPRSRLLEGRAPSTNHLILPHCPSALPRCPTWQVQRRRGPRLRPRSASPRTRSSVDRRGDHRRAFIETAPTMVVFGDCDEPLTDWGFCSRINGLTHGYKRFPFFTSGGGRRCFGAVSLWCQWIVEARQGAALLMAFALWNTGVVEQGSTEIVDRGSSSGSITR